MRLLLYLMTAILSFSILDAQTVIFHDDNLGRGKRKRSLPVVVDTAQWETIYAHVMKDTFLKDEKADFEMLTIGKRFHWYGGYGDYQLDSIQMADPGKMTAMSANELFKLNKEYEPITINMLTSLEEKKLDYYGKIYINPYRYEEPIPDFNWELQDETMEVMGYECYKATTTWRGREWTAWYCDIPVNAGPWKFNGLPGLILRLEDKDGFHLFEAIEIKKTKYPFGYKKKSYCKTTREKYNYELRDYRENAGKIYAESGMVKLTPEEALKFRKKRLFFCPIELE